MRSRACFLGMSNGGLVQSQDAPRTRGDETETVRQIPGSELHSDASRLGRRRAREGNYVMPQAEPPSDRVLSYSSGPRPIKWKRYAIVSLLLPSVYVVTYLALRLFGVYHLFWNQGDWDSIDGNTGIEFVDRIFIPAAEFELYLQNRLKLTPAPFGG